ncbi:MAG: twin-arginine translocase TatA/TatE family subunit [Planctomycetes bacterium]|nr:twin-arginine translocase TatA/TatE family subunit [Planctomycetota bacterium]
MNVLGFWTPGPVEIIIILVIALLLFGKRLPEVGRALGRGIVEFKKGVKGLEDDIEDGATRPTRLPPVEPTAEEPPAAPRAPAPKAAPPEPSRDDGASG